MQRKKACARDILSLAEFGPQEKHWTIAGLSLGTARNPTPKELVNAPGDKPTRPASAPAPLERSIAAKPWAVCCSSPLVVGTDGRPSGASNSGAMRFKGSMPTRVDRHEPPTFIDATALWTSGESRAPSLCSSVGRASQRSSGCGAFLLSHCRLGRRSSLSPPVEEGAVQLGNCGSAGRMRRRYSFSGKP